MARHSARNMGALFAAQLGFIVVLTLLLPHAAVARPPANDGPVRNPAAPAGRLSTNGGPVSELTILYNFTGGADGGHPGAGGLLYLNGNLYGTALYGGDGYDDGVVFELSHNRKTGWTETPIFTFCGNASCNPYAAAGPTGGLATDGSGNLYGTTELGSGVSTGFGSGTLFELTPNDGGWTPVWLYTPCCAPINGVTFDSKGNFYGSLSDGYCGETLSGYGGSVYEFGPGAGGFLTLHTFCGGEGQDPGSPLTLHGGNIFGSTSIGGAYGQGIVFELQHYSPKKGWMEKTAYNFCALENCSDGANPLGGLIFDEARNAYGTTLNGGANDKGTVFKLTPSPQGWTETVLYRFCALPDCADGSYPQAGLVHDEADNLYGTTCNSTFGLGNLGPSPYFNMSGSVFQLTPDGVLNILASLPGCSLAPLTRVGDSFYGTISTGGPAGWGAIFEVKMR